MSSVFSTMRHSQGAHYCVGIFLLESGDAVDYATHYATPVSAATASRR